MYCLANVAKNHCSGVCLAWVERVLIFQPHLKLVRRVNIACIRIGVVENEKKKLLSASFLFNKESRECQNDSNAYLDHAIPIPMVRVIDLSYIPK